MTPTTVKKKSLVLLTLVGLQWPTVQPLFAAPGDANLVVGSELSGQAGIPGGPSGESSAGASTRPEGSLRASHREDQRPASPTVPQVTPGSDIPHARAGDRPPTASEVPRRKTVAPLSPGRVPLSDAVRQYVRELDQTVELLETWQRHGAAGGVRREIEGILEAKDAEVDAAGSLLQEKLDRIREALVSRGRPDQLADFDAFLSAYRGEHGALREGLRAVAKPVTPTNQTDAAERLLQRLKSRPAHSRDRLTGRGVPGASGLPSDPIDFRTERPSRASTTRPAYVGGQSEATDGDLDPNPDVQITPEIQALAAQLGQSAARIYEFVRDNTTFEPYFGSLKGSQATLETLAGNDYDLASLTIALLRASNIPARYVRGTVKIPTARIQNWLGVQHPDAVNRLLNSAGIDAIGIDWGGNGTIDWFEVDRVWVEAQVPHANYRGVDGSAGATVWVPLDPAFKLRHYQTGIPGIPDLVPFDENGYLATRTRLLAYEWYQNQVRDWLQTNMPGKGLGDVPYKGTIAPESLGLLPASLPHEAIAFTGEWTELPDILRHRFQITLLNGVGGTILDRPNLRTVQTSLSRITISYAAAGTIAGLAEELGGLEEVPAFLAALTPQLKIDGLVDTSGSTVNTGNAVNIRVRYYFPDNNPIEEVTHPRYAGDYHALTFDSHQVGEKLLDRRSKILIDANANVGTPSEDKDALEGELLNLTGLRYWQRVTQGDRAIGDIYQFRSVKQWFEILASGNTNVLYLYDRPFAVTPGSLGVDSQRQAKSQIGIDGDQTDAVAVFKLEGRNGSAQEHAVWEEVVHINSVSTIKALQFANETDLNNNGLPNNGDVLTLTLPGQTSLLCPGFPASSKSSMEAALSAGKIVKTPYCDFTMNQWHGVGWLEENPTTGAGAYLISGFLAGGETTLSEVRTKQVWTALGTEAAEALTRCADSQGVRTLALRAPRDVAHVRASNEIRRMLRREVESGRDVRALERPVLCDGRTAFAYAIVEDGREDWLASAGGSGTENPPSTVPNADEDGPPRENNPCAATGQPVSLFNGNMYHQFLDVEIPGVGPPLRFERTYNSQSTRSGPMGYGWSHNYEISLQEDPGISATVTEGNGRRTTFTDIGGGSYDSPPGVHEELTATGSGWELVFVNGDKWRFNTSGRLTAIEDAPGNQLAFAYNGLGQLSTIADALSRSLTLAYGGDGKLDTISDWTGRTWSFNHDVDANLISSTTPGDLSTPAATTTYTYFAVGYLAHNLKRVNLPESTFIEFEYYSNDKLYRHDESGLRKQSYVYQPLRRMTSVINSRGYRTDYTYAANNLITAIRYPDDTTVEFAYDSDSNRTQMVDEAGFVTSYTWDARGRLLTSTDPLGGVETFTYGTSFPTPTARIDRTGNPWTYGVDAVTGRVTSAQDPDGGLSQYAYDAKGRLATFTDQRGKVTTFAYDPGSGRVERIIRPLGIVWEYSYDTLGRLLSATDPEGGVTTFAHDVRDRSARVTDPLLRETALDYDQLGRVTGVHRPDGSFVSFSYDLVSNLTRVTDPLGRQTTYAYDDEGCGCQSDALLTRVDAPLGRTWRYEYDSRGRLNAAADPLGRVTRFESDGRGLLTARVRPDGSWVDYKRDALGRVTRIESDDGEILNYTYDSMGRVQTASSSATQQTFAYDDSGRLKQVADTLTGKTLQYLHDPAGNIIRLTDGESLATHYTYDDAGRLSQILDFESRVFGLSYDDADRLTGVVYPDGQTLAQQFNAAGRLTSIDVSGPGGTAVSRSFLYDAMDRVVTEQDAMDGNSAYTYDAAGRLVRADRTGRPDEVYAYDAANNLLVDPAGNPIRYDAADGVVSRGSVAYVTDERGNLVEKRDASGTTQYAYDWNNRLARVDLPTGGVVTYKYDPFGFQIERNHDGNVTRLLRDRSEVFARYDGAGSLARKYVRTRSIASALAVTTAGGRYYLHPDSRGSTVAVTNASGAVHAQRAYGAWGSAVGSSSGWDDPILYVGRDFDPAVGLVDMQARHYDPLLGRFLQRDPLGRIGGSENPYEYVGANPTSYVDPTGEFAWIAAGALIGAVVNVGVTYIANGGNVTGQQLAAAAISGAIAGGLGAVAGPLGGTVARAMGMASNGIVASVASGLISGAASGGAQVVSNLIDPCHASNPLNAALYGGIGGGLAKGLFPTKNLNSWAQAQTFAPSTASGLFGTPNAWLNLGSFATASGLGAASNFPAINPY